MIEFGVIRIRDDASLVEARNKLRRFVLSLQVDAITATRIAVAASAQCRRMMRHSRETRIAVGVESSGDDPRLVLTFQASAGLEPLTTRNSTRVSRVSGSASELARQPEGLDALEPFTALKRDAFESSSRVGK